MKTAQAIALAKSEKIRGLLAEMENCKSTSEKFKQDLREKTELVNSVEQRCSSLEEVVVQSMLPMFSFGCCEIAYLLSFPR
jgi:hypothetical protein